MILLALIGFVVMICVILYMLLFLIALIPNTMFFASYPGVSICVVLREGFKSARGFGDIALMALIAFTSIPLIILQAIGTPFASKDE